MTLEEYKTFADAFSEIENNIYNASLYLQMLADNENLKPTHSWDGNDLFHDGHITDVSDTHVEIAWEESYPGNLYNGTNVYPIEWLVGPVEEREALMSAHVKELVLDRNRSEGAKKAAETKRVAKADREEYARLSAKFSKEQF